MKHEGGHCELRRGPCEFKLGRYKAVAQETRKKLKLTQAKRLMDMMAKAIEYGGPLSVDNIDGILFKLNLKETLNEVKLARATLDATIRQKCLVKNADGKGTFVNEPLSQLKSSLRDAIKPSDSPKLSIEELLARAYQNAYASRKVKNYLTPRTARMVLMSSLCSAFLGHI